MFFILLQEAFDSVEIPMQSLRETDNQRRVVIKDPMRRISLPLLHTNTYYVARKTHLSHSTFIGTKKHSTRKSRASAT